MASRTSENVPLTMLLRADRKIQVRPPARPPSPPAGAAHPGGAAPHSELTSPGALLGTPETPTQMMDSLEQLHDRAQRGGFCRRAGWPSRARDTRSQRWAAAAILLLARVAGKARAHPPCTSAMLHRASDACASGCGSS